MRLYSCWLCRHRVGAVLTTRLRRHHIPRSRLLCRHYNDQLEASHWKIRQNICVCWHTQPMYPIAKFLTLENSGLPMAKFRMSAVVVDYMNSWILNFAIAYTRKSEKFREHFFASSFGAQLEGSKSSWRCPFRIYIFINNITVFFVPYTISFKVQIKKPVSNSKWPIYYIVYTTYNAYEYIQYKRFENTPGEI